MRIEVLTPPEWLRFQMRIIETAGRTCYQSNKGEVTLDSARGFIAMILKRGHESVIEHSLMTVRFSGVSRGFCYDDQTEVLTRDGWKLFCDTGDGEEFLTLDLEKSRIEYQQAEGRTCEPWDGSLIHAESSVFDLAVTPNHRMLYFPRDTHAGSSLRVGEGWRIGTAEDIFGKYVKFLRGIPDGGSYENGGTVELGRLMSHLDLQKGGKSENHMAWILGLWTIGFPMAFPSPGDVNMIHVDRRKGPVKMLFRQKAEAIGLEHASGRNGFRILGDAFARDMESMWIFGDRGRECRIPRFVMEWPIDLLESFRAGIVAGGEDGNSPAVYTPSRDLAGDLQELFMRTETCATVKTVHARRRRKLPSNLPMTVVGRGTYYVVSYPLIANTALCGNRQWSRRPYRGDVYCVTVPNGTLYVRRNGKACWSGNTHELVRHRLNSFSQESTRYVDEKGFDMVLPPGRDWNDHIDEKTGKLQTVLDDLRRVYEALRGLGWRAEDARQFLPIGMANEIVTSANFRQWRLVFRLRTDKAAHWEIRAGMGRLLEMVRADLSPIFDSFVVAGKCRKGVPFYEERPPAAPEGE